MEMKVVENNYKMRVGGIVNDLKVLMKGKRGFLIGLVKNKGN